MRQCSKCKKKKSLDKFYKRSSSATPYLATPEARYEKICKECRKQHMKDNFRAYIYGISLDKYLSMLQEQDGYCGICGNPPGQIALCVDHNHTTGDVRGLLCEHCNKALGFFKDSTSILIRAVRYLENYQ